MRLAAAALAALLLSPDAAAQSRRSLNEAVEAALRSDAAYDDAERASLLETLRARFADYGLQVLDARRAPALPVVLHVLTEGSFDGASHARMAEVAFAAYQAVSRGADPDVVEGIALYGYRKQIPGERIALWANGFRQLVENKVPAAVAADLVRLSMEKDIPDSDFNILKWALVDGVKAGHDAKDYATFLFGFASFGVKPGKLAGDAKEVFAKARASRRRPSLPDYEGVFSTKDEPRGATPADPAPAPSPAPAPRKSFEERAAELRAKAERARPSPAPAPRSPSAPAPRATSKPSPAPPQAPAHAVAPASAELEAIWPGLESSAKSYLGTPYVWGGTTKRGIDCSALTQNSYADVAVRLPRVSREQYKVGRKVDDLREGDLVFFNTMGAGVSHVALVTDAKKGTFIHASSSKGVSYADMGNKYFKQRYLGARRVVR